VTITPSYLEDRISQIPALRLLTALDWRYLPPDEALRFAQRAVCRAVAADGEEPGRPLQADGGGIVEQAALREKLAALGVNQPRGVPGLS